MLVYVKTTGVLFAVLALVHLWRIVEEGHLATDPWFLLVTAITAGSASGRGGWSGLRGNRACESPMKREVVRRSR